MKRFKRFQRAGQGTMIEKVLTAVFGQTMDMGAAPETGVESYLQVKGASLRDLVDIVNALGRRV
jgi:hypothetical protein